MKRILSILCIITLCLTMAPVPASAFSVNYRIEGSREINEIHFDENHQITAFIDYYIGDVTRKLTLKYEGNSFERLHAGREFDFSVYFLPDEQSVLETNITIDKIPANGEQYCFIDGAVYWKDDRYVGFSPIFTWGEYTYNAQSDTWEREPIGPGKDGITLSLGIYSETYLDDGQGNFLDFCKVNSGEELVFSSPQDPKGIPYIRYYELCDGEELYNFVLKYLVLTPAIANEILETGGHYENSTFYPLLEYFPELEQLILDAQAKGYAAPQSNTAASTAGSATISAVPTPSTVLVDGKNIVFDSYNINNNNYFKLRDLASVFNGTGKQFAVGWDSVGNAITLKSGMPYTAVGGEMAGKGAGAKQASETTSKVLLDGRENPFTAYNIDGNNYFKLRDIGEAFDFGVDWNAAEKTIVISTEKNYGQETPPVSTQPAAPTLTHPATMAEREQKSKEAAKQWADSMGINEFSDYTKASMIYAYLYENVELQTDQSTEAYKTNFGNEAYAALVMKKAACSGFCKAVMLLCAEAGLECKHINAGGWQHQWNLVLVDGQWIVLDAQGGIFGVTKHPLE